MPSAPAAARAQPTVSANFRVNYPPGMMPNMTPPEETATVPKTREEWLDQIANVARPGTFRYVIRRTRPPTHAGYRLALGNIGEMEPLPYQSVVEAIQEWHGGGDYQVLVKNSEGNIVGQVPVNIDIVMHEPRITASSQRIGGPGEQGGGYAGGYAAGQHVPGMLPGQAASLSDAEQKEVTETRRLRSEEQRLLQEESVKKALVRNIQMDKALEAEKKPRESEEDMQAVRELREEMRAMVGTIVSGLKDITTAMAAGKDDKTMPLLIETMREQREQQRAADERAREQQRAADERARESNAELTKLLLGVMAAPKPNGESEVVKAVLAANQQATQCAVEAAKKESGQLNRIVELVMTNKINSSELQTKQMLDLMNMGRTQVMETLQLHADLTAQNQEIINPDNGFWSNFGNMALSSIGKLVQGIGAGVANRNGLPMMLPAPTEAQPLGTYTTPAVQVAPAYAPQAVVRPVQGQVISAAPVETATVAQAPNVLHMFYDGILQDVVPAAAAPAAASGIQPAVAAGDLGDHVTEAMQMAVADIAAGRTEQDWADYAVGKWGHFLQALSQAADDQARLRLIQTQCNPTVFQQLYQALSNNAVGMRNFLNSLHTVLAEYAKELTHAVA
jgi:hypothetical protein